MAKSGLKHIDVGSELSKPEWESEESHELIHGTSFPSSPEERQLFYRDDEHKWYIYDGTDWVWLGGSGGGMEVHGNEYHSPDFATEATLATHAAATSGVHGAGGNNLWHGGLANIIDKSHLSQDFGASSLRLLAWNFTPKQGAVFNVGHGATSPFSGKINSNPTSTSVVYDGESNENCLKGVQSGATRWGRFVLHNTTRGTSRLVVSWDVDMNTITTEPSTDDWADDDDITLQSQTCTQAGYMDVDLSDELGTAEIVAYIQFEALDKSAAAQSGRRVMVHPFETYDAGKRLMCPAALANEFTVVAGLVPINSQKLCVFFDDFTDAAIQIAVLATVEHADT